MVACSIGYHPGMADNPYEQLAERLRIQFGAATEPALDALQALLARSDLVPKAEFERAMAEVAALRDVVADLEARLLALESKPPSPPPHT